MTKTATRPTCYIVRRARQGHYDQTWEYSTLREARRQAARYADATVHRGYGPKSDRAIGEQV